MSTARSESAVVARVRSLVQPIASDLGLDLYDVEQRGGTLRVTLDTPAGSERGVDLDQLALATRLVSRELDHEDPVPGRYTLEVTSPGVERTLRTPEHFSREIGKTITIRLAGVEHEERRLQGLLVAADDRTATLRLDDQVDDTGAAIERVIPLDQIDKARTVFVWGPAPKPTGAKRAGTTPTRSGRAASGSATSNSDVPRANQEEPTP